MRNFNEDTRVKIPATLQFLRLGYQYQSMNDSDIDFNTKIFINRFKPALEKINGRSFPMEKCGMSLMKSIPLSEVMISVGSSTKDLMTLFQM